MMVEWMVVNWVASMSESTVVRLVALKEALMVVLMVDPLDL